MIGAWVNGAKGWDDAVLAMVFRAARTIRA